MYLRDSTAFYRGTNVTTIKDSPHTTKPVKQANEPSFTQTDTNTNLANQMYSTA